MSFLRLNLGNTYQARMTPITIVPTELAKSQPTVTLHRRVTVGAHDDKRQATVPQYATRDAESLMRTILEFKEASKAAQLSLTTGPNLYSFF